MRVALVAEMAGELLTGGHSYRILPIKEAPQWLILNRN